MGKYFYALFVPPSKKDLLNRELAHNDSPRGAQRGGKSTCPSKNLKFDITCRIWFYLGLKEATFFIWGLLRPAETKIGLVWGFAGEIFDRRNIWQIGEIFDRLLGKIIFQKQYLFLTILKVRKSVYLLSFFLGGQYLVSHYSRKQIFRLPWDQA